MYKHTQQSTQQSMQPTPLSAENLSFYCSQLLDNELPAAELDRLVQQVAQTPAAAQMTQHLHRYALIRQHLQAPQHQSICSHIDLSTRVHAAINHSETSDVHDTPNQFSDYSSAKPLRHKKRAWLTNGRTSWALSGLAAGVMLTVGWSWLNLPANPSLIGTPIAIISDEDLSNRLLSTPMQNDQLRLRASVPLHADTELADADRTRLNEYYLMHASYGNNPGLGLARVNQYSNNAQDFNNKDVHTKDFNAYSDNQGSSTVITVQPVSYQE